MLSVSKDDTNVCGGDSTGIWHELVRLSHLHNLTGGKNSFASVLEVWLMVLWVTCFWDHDY